MKKIVSLIMGISIATSACFGAAAMVDLTLIKSKEALYEELVIAIENNCLDNVKKIIEAEVDVNIPDVADGYIPFVNITDAYGYTPLHMAATRGNLEIVKELVMAGANVNAQGKESRMTPLHFATQNGHAAIVMFLVGQAGADKTLTHFCHETAADFALRYNKPEIYAYLDDPFTVSIVSREVATAIKAHQRVILNRYEGV